MRHLKNLNELVLYASVSCGCAFVGRLFPALYFPVLLLRLAIFLYCAYVIANLEQNKELTLILGSAILIGMIGGYWDLIEVWLRYDFNSIAQLITITLLFIASLLGLFIYTRNNGKASQK
jgi:CDP-diglyceride synthetase